MVEILNAHGSKNDIFVAAMRPRDFAAEPDLLAFVRRLCDRNGPLGADGVYFYDAGPRVPQAWFFNPDGSPAEFCGNGMRCLGRVILDLRGADVATVRSGQREYTVRRGATTAQGVRQISLEHPAVDFHPAEPVVAGRNPLIGARLPELDPALEFTAVTIPNPHLVALVDSYTESGLIAMGERIAARRDVFPVGANLSVLLPLGPTEIFVRTFERGAGLTASCGSGMAASRAVYSLPGRIAPERRVVVRNAGGMATVSLHVRLGQWCPVLEGNATLVYRVAVDPAAHRRARALSRRAPRLFRPGRAERRPPPRRRHRIRRPPHRGTGPPASTMITPVAAAASKVSTTPRRSANSSTIAPPSTANCQPRCSALVSWTAAPKMAPMAAGPAPSRNDCAARFPRSRLKYLPPSRTKANDGVNATSAASSPPGSPAAA